MILFLFFESLFLAASLHVSIKAFWVKSPSAKFASWQYFVLVNLIGLHIKTI